MHGHLNIKFILLVFSKEAGLESVLHMYQQNEWNNGFIKLLNIP